MVTAQLICAFVFTYAKCRVYDDTAHMTLQLLLILALCIHFPGFYFCRPYIVNLLPCLGRICKREDEGIQETLMLTMQKISPALMVFANDTEIKVYHTV